MDGNYPGIINYHMKKYLLGEGGWGQFNMLDEILHVCLRYISFSV